MAFFLFSWFLFRGDVAEADADLERNGMTFLVGISGFVLFAARCLLPKQWDTLWCCDY